MQTNWGDLVRKRLGITSGELFTPAQVAEIICVSADKVRRDIQTGLLTGTDINGGYRRVNWRITRADITDYVARVEADA